jgi:hypothetical protein
MNFLQKRKSSTKQSIDYCTSERTEIQSKIGAYRNRLRLLVSTARKVKGLNLVISRVETLGKARLACILQRTRRNCRVISRQQSTVVV